MGVSDDLRSFSREHGGNLGAADPHAVLDAERALGELWKNVGGDLARELGGAENERIADAGAAVAGVVAGVGGLLGLGIGLLLRPRSEPSCRVLNPALRTANQRVLDGADPFCAALRTTAAVESALAASRDADWGIVALAFGPAFEEVAARPLLEAGELVWRTTASFTHGFYEVPLRETFERGRAPTMVTFEAILYLLRKVGHPAKSPLPWGRLFSHYYNRKEALDAMRQVRDGRNAIHHPGRPAWNSEMYSCHVRFLFGAPTLGAWLSRSFDRDDSGLLAEGSDANAFGALLVERHVFDAFDRLRLDELAALAQSGVVSPADVDREWLERVLAQARLEDAPKLLETRFFVREQIGSEWRAPRIRALSPSAAITCLERGSVPLDELTRVWPLDNVAEMDPGTALKMGAHGYKPPCPPPEKVRRAMARRANPTQLMDLLSEGWLLPSDVDASRLGAKQLSLGQALSFIDLGVLSPGALPSSFWSAKAQRASRAQALRMVELGVARPEDFRGSWRDALTTRRKA